MNDHYTFMSVGMFASVIRRTSNVHLSRNSIVRPSRFRGLIRRQRYEERVVSSLQNLFIRSSSSKGNIFTVIEHVFFVKYMMEKELVS